MTISRRTFIEMAGLGAATVATRPFQWIAPRSDFEALRASIKGSLILPVDGGYDRARRVWSFNPHTDARPAAIVRCADANDVVKSVTFAREQSLELAVRGGGHDILGASTCEGGLVVDLSAMKRIDIDPSRRHAHVGPGVLSGELKAAAVPFDVAPVLGCNPSVGVGGLTLGGGIGWFLGTHGAACDNLVSAAIVTADGALLRASADSNADLYWAIRGGGGNFGVATQLELQLHPVGNVVGGVVAFRPKDIRPFLRLYRSYMKAAPDALTVELSIFADPDPTIWAMVCWSGEPKSGLRVLEPLRRIESPVADTVEVVPWARFLAHMPQRTMLQTPNTYWRGGSLSELSDTAIDKFASSIERAPAGWQLGIGHYMHGRICQVPPAATPFRRTVGQSTNFISSSWGDPADADAHMRWVDSTWEELHRVSQTGTYVNYLSESSEAAVRASYGDHYARLATIKHRYDPDNVFHRNRNIRPA